MDAADPAHEQQVAAVEAILADLGLAETRRIRVMNKIDLLPPAEAERVRVTRRDGDLQVVAVSAKDGATTASLLEAVEAALASQGFEDVAADGHPDGASLPS